MRRVKGMPRNLPQRTGRPAIGKGRSRVVDRPELDRIVLLGDDEDTLAGVAAVIVRMPRLFAVAPFVSDRLVFVV